MDDSDAGTGVPEWVVTYGDMMSLLLTFFIMLVSLSEIKSDEGKTRRALDAIRQAFGPAMAEFGTPGRSFQESSIYGKRSSQSMRSEGGAKRSGRESAGSSGTEKTVSRISEGTLIVLGGAAQFGRFEVRLNEELKRNLDIIARVARSKPNRIMIRGHASPEPLPRGLDFAAPALGCRLPLKRFDTAGFLRYHQLELRNQYDLSFARAKAVADYLVSKGISPRRLVITAAGDSEQRKVTRHLSGQKWNRRVDVFLLDTYIASPPLTSRLAGVAVKPDSAGTEGGKR